MKGLALLAMLLVACERETRPAPDTSARTPAPADTAAPSVTLSPASVSGAVIRPACPATGLWAECSILYRLDRAGIGPVRDTAAVAEPPLTPRGLSVRVGRSDLEIYLYPNAAARERELSRLDRAAYVEYPAPVPMKPVPTLIVNANLIAILHSRNDHLRERVSDAITAGPPQKPSKP